MHPDEEQVQRLLHGELAPATVASLREHLALCADCRERLAQAERDETAVNSLLRQVDHPPPRVDATAVVARAHGHMAGWGRWAAGILLMLGVVGVAYATPGSPLPGWVRAVVTWVRGAPEHPTTAPTSAEAPSVAGIAVIPGQNLVLLFAAAQTEGQARVTLTDGPEVVVRAVLGAATFTSDLDRLEIHNQGSSATFEIEIPKSAPRVEIRVGSARVFLKQGSHITTDGSLDSIGPFRLPLTPGGS